MDGDGDSLFDSATLPAQTCRVQRGAVLGFRGADGAWLEGFRFEVPTAPVSGLSELAVEGLTTTITHQCHHPRAPRTALRP